MLSPNPYAPYAPPAPHEVAAGYRTNVLIPAGQRRGNLPVPALRTSKLILGILFVVVMFAIIGFMVAAGVLGAQHDEDGVSLMVVGMVISTVAMYAVLIALSVVGLVWVYRFWSWIPPEHRHTKLWKRYISPAAAVGLLLVPYFNLYWMFVVYFGMCDALDRMRVAYPTSKPAPKNLAIAMLVAGFVFFPVAPFLQYLFDKELEEIAHEMEPALPPRLV